MGAAASRPLRRRSPVKHPPRDAGAECADFGTRRFSSTAARILTLPPRREDRVSHPTTSGSFSSLIQGQRSTARDGTAEQRSASKSEHPEEVGAQSPTGSSCLWPEQEDDLDNSPISPCTATVCLGGPWPWTQDPAERRFKRHKSLLKVSRSYENALRERKTVCWDSDEHVRVFSSARLVVPETPCWFLDDAACDATMACARTTGCTSTRS